MVIKRIKIIYDKEGRGHNEFEEVGSDPNGEIAYSIYIPKGHKAIKIIALIVKE